jgi:hypothetical protein
MDVTEEDVARIPRRTLRVPQGEFVAVWIAAERHQDDQARRGVADWYGAGVLVTCRWLANATVRPVSGPWRKEPAPISRRQAGAYEELIEAECLAAEKLLIRRQRWMAYRPGWVEGILATLCWAWRRSGPAPIEAGHSAAS